MADEIRLVTYANQQVTPQNDAVLTNLETPNNGIIFGCEISIKNASTLHINSGMGVIYGREFEIVDSDISVPLPGAGTEVGQLYIHIDLANTSEPIQILVEAGASLTPMVDDANLNVTTGITEYQLATFNVSTATISDLVVTFENTKDIRTELGDADISGIGDGSVKGAISQINSDLSDNQWVNVPITKNGSGSTMTGNVQHNSFLGLKKVEIRWSNTWGFSDSEALIFTFDNYYPNEPLIVHALVGGTTTYASYNSVTHGMYVALPNGTYSANTEIRISGIMG